MAGEGWGLVKAMPYVKKGAHRKISPSIFSAAQGLRRTDMRLSRLEEMLELSLEWVHLLK